MKVGPWGLFQPIRDVIKLFSKVDLFIRFNYNFYWFFSPFISILIYLFILIGYPIGGGELFLNLIFFLFLCFLRFTVYFLIYGGYHSGRKYSLIGSYRSISQIISYEVALIFMFVGYFNLVGRWNLTYKLYEYKGIRIVFCFCYVFIWLIVILAESNRLPYDFLEGESELVSGFNTEYWGVFFSFFFIFEYGSILLFSILRRYFLFSGILSFLFFCFIINFFLWIRASVPRFRYDILITLIWKKIFLLIILIDIYIIFI